MSVDDPGLQKYEECWLEVNAAEAGGYLASVRLSGSRDFSETAPIEAERVREALAGLDNCGETLFDAFFTGRVAEGFAVARGGDAARPIRLRLRIPPGGLLQTLPWECLYDPQTRTALAAAPNFAVSRFFGTPNPVREPIPTQPLRILFVISNPSNLAELDLEPLTPEIARKPVEDALAKVAGQVTYEFLQERATPQNIRNRLEQGGFHVLHVLAHGYFARDKGYLVLEGDNGEYAQADEDRFSAAVLGLRQLRLVVLASCLSAKVSVDRTFGGLAPALVVKGVPAVLAMADKIGVDAAQDFVEEFYRQLSRTGIVDVAVNRARGRLYLNKQFQQDGQWSLPVLYMNTENGQLYYPSVNELGAGLPEDQKYLFADLIQKFVDRTDQHELFTDLVEGRKTARVLFAEGIVGMGTTWLVRRCAMWCAEKGHASRKLDFDKRRGGEWDHLTALDQLIGGEEERYQEYRTLVAQLTAGGQRRAFEEGNVARLTDCFFRCLAAREPAGKLAIFIDHLADAPQSVRDWIWNVFLPSFQIGRYPLKHVTVLVTSPIREPAFDNPDWLNNYEPTQLNPLDLPNFLEFARKYGVTDWNEERLAGAFEGWGADPNRPPAVAHSPYELATRLMQLKLRARQR